MSGADPDRFVELQEHPPPHVSKCMQVYRQQLVQTLRFITRLIYYFKITPNDRRCCQEISRDLQWISLELIHNQQVRNVWGPELYEFCTNIPPTIEKINTKIVEYCLDSAFEFVPRDPPRNYQEELLKALKITQNDIERLYNDYLEHCFPSFYQTFESFRCYMTKHGFEIKQASFQKLFKAFNYNRNGYLSFHELLLGLACMEPNIPHGECRVMFVFRYYDSHQEGFLTLENFELLLKDLYGKEFGKEIGKKAVNIMKMIGTTIWKGKPAVTYRSFLAAIGSHKFRGTSVLCRASKPIFTQLHRMLVAKTMAMRGKVNLSSIIQNRTDVNEVCPTCLTKRYIVASHLVRFGCDGRIRYKTLDQVIKQTANKAKGRRPNIQQYSIDVVFNYQSAANILIKLIRDYSKNKGTAKKPNALMENNKDYFWALLLSLYNELDALLELEDKCQKLYSPIFIIGDIHGNLEDLMSMETCLWKQLPVVTGNFCFLGDYVDRGVWSLECCLYLVAFKILCPSQVTLLRGNHEDRTLQTCYTYKTECVLKYGEVFGCKIWELTNKMFDKLPVCAVIDDAVFAAHGGIPHATLELDKIAQIKREIRDPEKESDASWEILWSDPVHPQQFVEATLMQPPAPSFREGYLFNAVRGTAFLFNEVAVDNFLKTNGLTHVIRAHEVPANNFQFHFDTKCCTIFSCSHYCGNDNECVLILCDNERIRIIELDTTNNAPATHTENDD